MPTIPSSSLTALLKMFWTRRRCRSSTIRCRRTRRCRRGGSDRRWYTILLMSTRSSISRVFSIEPGRDDRRPGREGLDEEREHQRDDDAAPGSSRQKLRRRGCAWPLRWARAAVPGPCPDCSRHAGFLVACWAVARVPCRCRPGSPGRAPLGRTPGRRPAVPRARTAHPRSPVRRAHRVAHHAASVMRRAYRQRAARRADAAAVAAGATAHRGARRRPPSRGRRRRARR